MCCLHPARWCVAARRPTLLSIDSCTWRSIPPVLEAMKIFVGLTAADGYQTLLSNLGPDPQVSVSAWRWLCGTLIGHGVEGRITVPCYSGSQIARYLNIYHFLENALIKTILAVLRNAAAWAAEKSFKDEIFAECLRHSRPRSTKKLMEVAVARDRYIQMWETEVCCTMSWLSIVEC